MAANKIAHPIGESVGVNVIIAKQKPKGTANPHESRLIQRERKLAARAKQRERDAKLKEWLSPKPVFEAA